MTKLMKCKHIEVNKCGKHVSPSNIYIEYIKWMSCDHIHLDRMSKNEGGRVLAYNANRQMMVV